MPARAALAPAFLDAKAGPPERLRAVAVSDTSASVTWDLPAGNPRVDGYVIKVLRTNGTGWPVMDGKVGEVRAAAGERSAVIKGLKPRSYYAFVIQVGGLWIIRHNG